MDKGTYALLFRQAVDRALWAAKLSPASAPLVEFHGNPNPQHLIPMEQALDLLWLAPDRFYQFVDVAAFPGEEDPPVLFVRISGHPPAPFEKTRDPSDLGPFNIMTTASRRRPR